MMGGAGWNRPSDLGIISEVVGVSLIMPISLDQSLFFLVRRSSGRCFENQRDGVGLAGTKCWDRVGTRSQRPSFARQPSAAPARPWVG
jgi:hypothetical protein